jgi:outer membrane protein OmpA-like peptidoglycan-associated protein
MQTASTERYDHFMRAPSLNARCLGAAASLLLGGALLLSPGRAQAGPDYELGVFAGAQLYHPEIGLGRFFDEPTQTWRGQLEHSAAFGLRLGLGLHPRFALEGEIALMPTSTIEYPGPSAMSSPGQAKVMGVGYRLHGLVHFATGRVRPYLTIGGGGLSSTTSDIHFSEPATTFSVDGGLGMKIDVRPIWGIRIEGKAVLTPGRPDAPPLLPNGEVTIGFYARFGAKKAEPAPALPPDGDADTDGITNAADQCPEQAGIATSKGCPVAPGDADGDGIADALDKCPLGAEVKNDWQDDDGCPDEAPPAALRGVIGPMTGVSFAPDKAELLPVSYPALDRTVQALLASAETKIEIAAYSPTGSELALARAEAIKAYLINKGVHPDRLSTKALAKPEADGDKERLELRVAPGPAPGPAPAPSK